MAGVGMGFVLDGETVALSLWGAVVFSPCLMVGVRTLVRGTPLRSHMAIGCRSVVVAPGVGGAG